MIIRNNLTKKEYQVTEDGWKVITGRGWGKNYTVVGEKPTSTVKRAPQITSFIPEEIESMMKEKKTGKIK